ncbi:MAG: carbohydrate-binding family 9-like protein [Maribacter sp.]|uniref:carbohydrate-binding family 9-like protein n=1 Tax=Maribacter sp. TaxID=1897614 RepID=UPI003299444E
MTGLRICFLFFLALGSSAVSSQDGKKLSLGEQPIFKVSKAKEEIVVDGIMQEEIWANTESRTFDNFYRINQANDQQKTTFRMLWDEKNLYLFYQMEDKYLTARETKRDGEPYLDDCAEIFFITVPDSLDTHIGYELNLYKASNDFVYFNDFYQGQHGILKTFNPDFDVEVSYEGTVNDNSDVDVGWTMELAIPISNFDGLGTFVPVQSGNKWAFLAIRQDRNDAEGNRRATSTIFPIYDISKNVHQANRFGLMEFVD